MDERALAEAFARLLSDPGPGGLVERLVALAVDDAFDRPVGTLADPEQLADLLLAALSGPGPARLVAEHLGATVARERDRVAGSGETLAEWAPAAVVAEAAERFERPSGLPAGWWDGVVEPADVRELLSGALADTIEDVLSRVGLGGAAAGTGAGLLGTLARGAKAVRDTGSGLFGAAFGGAVQDGIRRQVRALAAQSATALKERFRERLRTPEGKVIVARIRDRAVRRLLELRVFDLHVAADDPGVDALGRWATVTLAHNLTRPAVQEAIRAQVRATFARVAERSARALLDELGLLPAARDALVARGGAWAAGVAGSEAFRAWLAEALVAAAAPAAPAPVAAPPPNTEAGKPTTKQTEEREV
jgi:hypothetical protein